MRESMLTTVDNPFDPFTDFEAWHAYDVAAGYNTLGLLARITNTSPEISEPDQALAIELGMDEVVAENVLGIHKKVSRESSDN